MDNLSDEMEQSLTLSIKAAEQAKGSAHQIAQGKVDVETTARAISDLTLNIDKTATTLDKLQSEWKKRIECGRKPLLRLLIKLTYWHLMLQ